MILSHAFYQLKMVGSDQSVDPRPGLTTLQQAIADEGTTSHSHFVPLSFLPGNEYGSNSLKLKRQDHTGDFVSWRFKECFLANAEAEYFLKENISRLPPVTTLVSGRLLGCNKGDT